jgi:membrane associated rhomboid family serine protease
LFGSPTVRAVTDAPNDAAAPRSSGEGRRGGGVPTATVVATVVVLLGALAQAIEPQLLDLLRRDVDGLRAGEWWRLASPLLVSSAGWGQLAFNAVTIAVMGVLAERRFGTAGWLALFFGAVVLAEPVAYVFEPDGAGSSLGICGLVGGLIAALLRRRADAGVIVVIAVTYYVAGLTGQAAGAAIEPQAGGMIGATVLSIVAGAAVVTAARRAGLRHAARLAATLALVGVTVLIGLGDTHGAALAAGFVVGWALPRLRSPDHVQRS